MLRFLDDLVPNEQFILCGYSYGALIARGIAHFRRNQVRGLLLCALVQEGYVKKVMRPANLIELRIRVQ